MPLTVEAAFALPYSVQDFGEDLQDNLKESVAAAVSSAAVRVQPFRVEILNITAAGGGLLSDSCVVAFSIRVPGADTAKAASIVAALTLADVNAELQKRGVQAATAVVQQAQVVTPPPATTTLSPQTSTSTPAPPCVNCTPCKATFIDNENNQYPNTSPVIINENTFVFGAHNNVWWKMAAVDVTGAYIESRYISMGSNQELTAEMWAAGQAAMAGYPYSVENVELCTVDAGTPPVYICCPELRCIQSHEHTILQVYRVRMRARNLVPAQKYTCLACTLLHLSISICNAYTYVL